MWSGDVVWRILKDFLFPSLVGCSFTSMKACMSEPSLPIPQQISQLEHRNSPIYDEPNGRFVRVVDARMNAGWIEVSNVSTTGDLSILPMMRFQPIQP